MTTTTTQDSGARPVASVKMGNPSLVFGRCYEAIRPGDWDGLGAGADRLRDGEFLLSGPDHGCGGHGGPGAAAGPTGLERGPGGRGPEAVPPGFRPGLPGAGDHDRPVAACRSAR